MATTARTTDSGSALSRFVNTPGTYKVFVVAVVYLVFYLAVGYLISLAAGDRIAENPVENAESILLGLALPIAIGGLALLWFVHHVGWLGEIFGRQPVRGSRWMWIAPTLVLVAIVGHVGQTTWSRWSAADVLAFAALGLCVGFTEELATRGIAVRMLRADGHAERYVAVVSSLVFSLMHLVNLLSGMSLKIVLSTVVYTLGFGMCMYLTMRVTGSIWPAIVLHGLTDPTTAMAVGGLDTSVGRPVEVTTWALVAVVATFALTGFGWIASFFVRGRAHATPPQTAPSS